MSDQLSMFRVTPGHDGGAPRYEPNVARPHNPGFSEEAAAKRRKHNGDVAQHRANNRRVSAAIKDHLLAIAAARSFGSGWTPWLSVREWADAVTERRGKRCPEDSARKILADNLVKEGKAEVENDPGTGMYRAMLTEAGRAALRDGEAAGVRGEG